MAEQPPSRKAADAPEPGPAATSRAMDQEPEPGATRSSGAVDLSTEPFPPRYIQRWTRRQGVMTCALIAELRAWADHLASPQSRDEMHRDDCRCFENQEADRG